ncbi:MAG: hypothetical protein ACLFS1_08070 [Opitutales bacterium]
MKPLFLLISALFFANLPAGAAKPLSEVIERDADLVLAVHDVTDLRESWTEHPLAKQLEDAGLSGLFGALSGNAGERDDPANPLTRVLEEEFNLTWQDLAELFPGQVGGGIYNLSELLFGGAEEPDLVILAEFSGSAERLDELMQIQFEHNARAQKEVNPLIEHELVEETFMGETLYFDEVFDGERSYTEDGFALVEGVFVLATPKERLRSAVESIKAGADSPLAQTRGYRRFREERPAGAATLYVNLEAMVPSLSAALKDPSKTGALAMFGASGPSMEASLALPSLLGFGFDLELTEQGAASHTALLFREKAGLSKLLAYSRVGLPPAPYVPENILSSTVTNFDLSVMFAELESILTSASPSAAPLLDLQLQNMKSQTGVDLRSAILENFGPEMVTLSVLPDRGPQSVEQLLQEEVYVIRIKDAASLSGALEALKDQVPGLRAQIEVREFRGQTIHRFKSAQESASAGAIAPEVSYAVTRSHLLVAVGRIALLQEVLAGMETGGEGFWQSPEVEEMFRRIRRSDSVARSYFDLSQAVGPALQSLTAFMALAGSNPGRDVELPADFEFPYLLISDMNETEDGFFSRSLLISKEVGE